MYHTSIPMSTNTGDFRLLKDKGPKKTLSKVSRVLVFKSSELRTVLINGNCLYQGVQQFVKKN